MNRRLPQTIVDRIIATREEREECLEKVAENLYKKFEVSKHTTNKIIVLFEEGAILGENFGTVKYERKEREWLRRFAIYLEYLNFEKEDPIIYLLKKFDSRFEYSPKSSLKKPKKQYVPK